MSNWNLPPGVTARMIDEAMGAGVCTCEREVEALVREGAPRDEAEDRIAEHPCEFCEAEARAERDEAWKEDAAWSRWEDR